MDWTSSEREVYQVDQRFAASQGTIQEVHCPARDAVMAPFPCFQTSARYDPGMSGGPVIGIDGLVHGVVCSSVHGLTDEEGYVSFASIVGPSALLQVTRLNDSGVPQTYFVGDLIQREIVSVDTTGVAMERLDNELRLHFAGRGVINSVLGS